MTENEALPASSSPSESRPDDSVLAALPEKLRVHALARLVGSSSREVLAVLAQLDVAARSAQSSVDRTTVSRVVEHFFPSQTPTEGGATEAAPAAGPAVAEPDLPEPPPESPAAVAPASAGGPGSAGGADTTGAVAPSTAPALFLAPESGSAGAGSAEGASGGGRRRRRASRSTGVVTPDGGAESTSSEDDDGDTLAEPEDAETSAETSAETPSSTDGESDDEAGRRRRRRGRRGRGRGRGGAEDEAADDSSPESEGESPEGESSDGQGEDPESDDSEDADSSPDGGDDAADGGSGSSRRRRRRRRRGGDDSGDGSTGDDPPNTVTHVREKDQAEKKRSSDDEVKGVKGSTRLEAKRQRRRDGRDQGRRRPSVLSESEFLARREAVERTMVVRQQADRNQIGVLEDGVLVEHFVASSGQNSMVGNVYLGRVQNVLPSMEAAFVDIGRGRNAVLYAGEVNWDASGLEGKQRKIEQALTSGDSVLVQVTKDPVGHKGARLTTQISLPGRFLVYVPGGGATGISRKLPEPERKRLKEILKRIVPSEAGVIIRTAAEGVEEAELERDVRRLAAQWEVIERTGREAAEGGKGKGGKGSTGKGATKAPTLVHEEPDLLIRVVRDMFNEDFSSLVISGEQAWETLEGYISHVAPELTPRVTRHVGPQDVFGAYRIDEQLVKALDRKVWLPSGGTLVIDRTEAMTVVDVNTGKFTGSGGNLEETVTRNNLEAAEEVVRQLRLRDIGGMIVIDFIDMVLESNRDLVLRRLTECLGRDRTRHQVAEVTSLGLVQMTRKRVGQGLLDEFSTVCEHCKGRGVIVHTEPVTGGHEHGARPSQNGSSASAASSSVASTSGEQPRHGTGRDGSGEGPQQNGSSGSGRRRGRGRRAAQSDGGSPATGAVTANAGEDGSNGASGYVPSPADVAAARRSGAGAEGADGSSGAAVADAAIRDGQGRDDSEVTHETEVALETEVVLETDLADESAAASRTPTRGEAHRAEPDPDEPSGAEPDRDEPSGTESSGTESSGTESSGTESSGTEPSGTEPDRDEPAQDPAPGGRRRRRGASRPAGPPVAVGGQ